LIWHHTAFWKKNDVALVAAAIIEAQQIYMLEQ